MTAPTGRAMASARAGAALALERRPVPEPGAGEILVRVRACGVCRTDLHVVDGDLPEATRPIVPGHEIVGTVARRGAGAARFAEGEAVGVPWLGWTCGTCAFCRRGEENLCPRARFTGYHRDGGYADFALVDERYALALPAADPALAPLLCAGLIGHRSLRAAGDPGRLGLYGFGAAAHIVTQVARFEGREVFAFTRRDDRDSQAFARSLGCAWAGASEEAPPERLDAAIVFAPVGALVPAALRAVRPGGTVVCAGIHMSDIPSFPYAILWGERTLRSVANLTRRDGEEFMALVARCPIEARVTTYPLEDAARALADLRAGALQGAAVLVP